MNINDDDDQQCSLLGRELPLCLRLHKIYRFSNIIGSSSSPSPSQPSPWSPSSSWLSMSSSSSPSSSLASISLCASVAQLGSDGSSLQTGNNQEVPPQHGHHHLHIFIIKVIKVMSGVDIVFIVTEKEFKTSHCLVSRTFCFLYGLLGQANWWALYGSLGSGQLIRKNSHICKESQVMLVCIFSSANRSNDSLNFKNLVLNARLLDLHWGEEGRGRLGLNILMWPLGPRGRGAVLDQEGLSTRYPSCASAQQEKDIQQGTYYFLPLC